jgi:hypothetical protein
MQLSVYMMAPEPITTAYFIDHSHQSVCLYVYRPIVARQRLDKHVFAATNTLATIEELLDASSSIRCVSYQRRVFGSVYPPIVARQRLGTHVPAQRRIVGVSFSMPSLSYQRKVAISSSQKLLFYILSNRSRPLIFQDFPLHNANHPFGSFDPE